MGNAHPTRPPFSVKLAQEIYQGCKLSKVTTKEKLDTCMKQLKLHNAIKSSPLLARYSTLSSPIINDKAASDLGPIKFGYFDKDWVAKWYKLNTAGKLDDYAKFQFKLDQKRNRDPNFIPPAPPLSSEYLPLETKSRIEYDLFINDNIFDALLCPGEMLNHASLVTCSQKQKMV